MKKILISTLLIISLVIPMSPAVAQGQGCIGNILEGVLSTETGGVVYLNSTTWDLDFPGTPSPVPFATYYDVNNPAAPFSGQAWSETFGWLIFTGSTAYFQEPNTNPNLWGGWDGTMDLSGITLSGFNLSGTTFSAALTSGLTTDVEDWWVGAGVIDFSGATLTGNMGNGCLPGQVDLFVNGNISYNQTGSCPITNVTLTWTSSDVSNCQTGSGSWGNPGPRATQELSGESTSVLVNDGNNLLFTLNCVSTNDGTPVTGSASVSCNTQNEPGGGTGGTGTGTIPDFIET